MAIHSDKNLFPGINPHLNSFLQDEGGGWESFHAAHILDIARTLDTHLPSNYYAVAEKSLQISAIGLEEEVHRRIEPDVTVYQLGKTLKTPGHLTTATAPATTLPLAGVLEEDEDDYLTSVIVYHIEGEKLPGTPVTRIELLSPANKPAGSYYRQYLAKRREGLRGGLSLVEIDYLHETRPITHLIPSYPDGHQGALPFIILVNDPRPTPKKGEVRTYPFGIDDIMPVVEIPLADSDNVALDFGVVYNHTIESSRVFRLVVDYEQEPANFDRYSEADREHIRQRMAAIAEQHASSRNT